MLSSRCVSVCVQGILINVQKVSAKWNRNELLSSGCPLPLLLCLSVHSFIITPLTAAPWTMLRQRHRRVWRRRRQSSDGADQQQQSSRISLTHTHVHQWVRSLLYLSLSSLSVFALSTNQTSRCFVRALYHLLLILLILLLLFFASSSCCCNVVMEVKRRAYMKTSLQFNVRTWHSAATSCWPFRYSNWWLSFLRSVLIRSSTHSLSLTVSVSLGATLLRKRTTHHLLIYTHTHAYKHTFSF